MDTGLCFSCFVFIWVCYEDNADFIKWVGSVYFSILRKNLRVCVNPQMLIRNHKWRRVVLSFFLLKKLLFLHIWPHWVFVAALRLSLVATHGGFSSLWWRGFAFQWLLLLQSRDSSMWASVVVASELSTGSSLALDSLVAPWQVESFQTRDWTHVPYIGRQILNH